MPAVSKSQLNILTADELLSETARVAGSGSLYDIQTLIAHEATESAAKDLDAQLARAGIKTGYKFSCDYKMPGMSQNLLKVSAYQIWAASNNSTADFYDAAVLTRQFADFIWSYNPNARDAFFTSRNDRQNMDAQISLLLGASNSFHIRDIVWYESRFINDKTRSAEQNNQAAFKDEMSCYGINTGCLVLCELHQKALRSLIANSRRQY
ncbi:MAG: hypothetical protein LBJ18_01690 [Rickettsiales bacterium]|jgi:hypothetical protein|nr:hypothetical protein [Rickettsiales bacterium]